MKVSKLNPSKYIPIVVVKKAAVAAAALKNGDASTSTVASSLSSSTQVTFTKSHHQRSGPFINGNGPAALKSPIVRNHQLRKFSLKHRLQKKANISAQAMSAYASGALPF